MALGDRNISFVLDDLSPLEIEAVKQSLNKALKDIDAYIAGD